MPGKEISIADFQSQIQSVKSLAVTGFRWSGTPQLLLRLVRETFDNTGNPSGITIMFTSSPTDPGLDHLAHEDLLHCSFGSYYGSIPQIRVLVQANKIQAYSLPQGQLSLLFREIGRGSPGLISTVGRHTFVDPEITGGKLNACTTADVVTPLQINGDDYLFYHARPVDAALIRGTIADAQGNISMCHEPVKTEFLAMAQAARTSGGRVFVQVVKTISEKLPPADVDLPAHLVDSFIVCADVEKDHRHTNLYDFNAGLLNHGTYANTVQPDSDPLYKKLIARRALRELQHDQYIILGQGIPELTGVYAKADPQHYSHMLTYMESGVIGGIPERRPDFGVALDPDAFLTQDNQFVGFNGGHMETAVLSFVQFDQKGQINVSIIGSEYFGCGGYIDICHAVKKLIFVGSFTAKGLQLNADGNSLTIASEGLIKKAVSQVDQVTFSPALQQEKEQQIMIVTERCVFTIADNQVTLAEVVAGVDVQNDILDLMDFKPLIADPLLPLTWD